MDSTRQQKYAKLIQKDMSDIFLKDAKSMFGNLFITVTQVRVSPDLGLAKIYLSLMMTNDKEESLELIRAQTKPLRKLLGDRIRKQARIIPELAFFLDDSIDYAMHIESIMSKIDIPKEDKEKE
jgi:ribosome-binding factor A